MYIIFDVETTGLIEKDGSNNYYKYTNLVKYENARMIQISYEILNKDLNVIKTANYYINEVEDIPNTNIHGITLDKLKLEGISFKDFVSYFIEDIKNIQLIIAHNLTFDLLILLSELYRHNYLDLIQNIKKLKYKCSMKLTTDIIKLPSKYGKYKYPKLIELYNYTFSKDLKILDNAHNSIYDVQYLREILIELKNRNILDIFN